MKLTLDKNYGADADGNRGVSMIEYELEDTPQERSDIAELLILQGYTEEDSGSVGIVFEEMEIQVNVEEYKEEIKALESGESVDQGRRKVWMIPTVIALGAMTKPAIAGGSCIGDHHGWDDNQGGHHGRS